MSIGKISYEEFRKNVIEWGDRTGIYRESTWQKQFEKYGAERAELLYAESNLERMDAYGDQLVCLIHCDVMCKDFGAEWASLNPFMTSTLERLLHLREFDAAMNHVFVEIDDNRLDSEECMWLAWEGQNKDGIKYRVGLMISGKFVKWDNLSHEDRVLVAQSGQLSTDYANLDHCESLCTPWEWLDIKSIIAIGDE